MQAAQIGTGLAYTTVFNVAHEKSSGLAPTLKKLEEWSKRVALPKHGVFISAAKTLGLQ